MTEELYEEKLYPPADPPWKVKDVVVVFLLYILLVIGFGLLLGLAAGDYITEHLFAEFIISSALEYGGLIILICLISARRGAAWREFGFSLNNISSNILFGLISGIVLLFAVTIVGDIIAQFWSEPVEDQYVVLLLKEADSVGAYLLIALVSCLLAPFAEELFFRGFIYPAFRAKIGIWPAMTLTAVLFGAMHLDLFRLLPLALGGFGLTWLYEKSGSIFTPMIAHAAWNTISFILVVTVLG